MNLSTTYMGLKLRSPLVVGAAAPLTEDIDNIKRMEDYGAAAVVLHSFFEEQLRKERLDLQHQFTSDRTSFFWQQDAIALPKLPQIQDLESQKYLKHIQKAKETVNIPIIASLNGSTVGGWGDYAYQIQQAGADALELNLYYVPTDPELSGSLVEQAYIDILEAVKSQVRIPVAIKLSPYFSNMANMGKRLADAGADALVLFNRFYQPDIDLETLEVEPNLLLSTPHEMRLPLRWMAILYGKISADLAATSGIHKAEDVLKMLMAGANITMLVSVLLRCGIQQIRVIEQELLKCLEDMGYESIQQVRGMVSQLHCPDPSAFERAQYIKTIVTTPDIDPTGTMRASPNLER
jgi:dihydroorotate dehydrogenase (fumarate)